MSNRKVVFLDIDGVLNSSKSFVAFGASWPSDDPKNVKLDPAAVGCLRFLVDKVDAVIHVHSTWASDPTFTDQYMIDVLANHGFPGAPVQPVDREIAKTGERAHRIQKLIIKHGLGEGDYVILDDAAYLKDDFTYDEHGLIQTDGTEGFGYMDMAKALRYFGQTVPIIMM